MNEQDNMYSFKRWFVCLCCSSISLMSFSLSLAFSQDSDITQEVVLKHHESVSLLKRIFMEDVPIYGPTEWDRRLSSYTPVVYPKISNGDLFSGLELVSLHTPQLLHHISVWNVLHFSRFVRNQGLSFLHHWQMILFSRWQQMEYWSCDITPLSYSEPIFDCIKRKAPSTTSFFSTAPVCHWCIAVIT